MYYSKIVATGSCVPDMVITNDDMAKIVDTNDEWISSRSGIKRRHYSRGENTSDLAGGVFTREDIDHYMALGADGVQMATRFVTTYECDAPMSFKEAYLNASKEDIVIVKSPVGMPGRAIRNPYVRLREQENEKITHCFRCLEKCDPANTPYCITMALIRAVRSNDEADDSLIFCGENAYRLNKLTTVKEIFDELNQ